MPPVCLLARFGLAETHRLALVPGQERVVAPAGGQLAFAAPEDEDEL